MLPKHNPNNVSSKSTSRILRLLYPGIRIKRWLFLGMVGVIICSVGATFYLRRLLDQQFPEFLSNYAEPPMAVIGLIAGLTIILVALAGLYRTFKPLLVGNPAIGEIGYTLYRRLHLQRGPRIVALGGGTGMSVLLSGLKNHTDNLTAIIGVSDDGGSSGRLRRELGVLPPGDFRNCIVAMSDEESLLPELLQYRFTEGEGLKGHSFGNLFLVAMSNVTTSFVNALSESSKVLAVRGTILPATTNNLKLSAKMTSGEIVHGESNITQSANVVDTLYIDPPNAEAFQPAVEAIMNADIIVMGPGSLYTSILPNLMVNGIQEAILETKAIKFYVCNVATESGETNGYGVLDHVKALLHHTHTDMIDIVIANDNLQDVGPHFQSESVKMERKYDIGQVVSSGDLIDESHPIRHDSNKLSKFIIDKYVKN